METTSAEWVQLDQDDIGCEISKCTEDQVATLFDRALDIQIAADGTHGIEIRIAYDRMPSGISSPEIDSPPLR